jgi:hypothetical protein
MLAAVTAALGGLLPVVVMFNFSTRYPAMLERTARSGKKQPVDYRKKTMKRNRLVLFMISPPFMVEVNMKRYLS